MSNVIELPRRQKDPEERAEEISRAAADVYRRYARESFDEILRLSQSAPPLQASRALETVLHVLKITADALRAEVVTV